MPEPAVQKTLTLVYDDGTERRIDFDTATRAGGREVLKRLETASMLTVRSVEHEGRLRKYYHITQQGIDRIEEFRDDWKEILSIYQFITREDADND